MWHNSDDKGVAFVVEILSTEGVELDVENMVSTFEELQLHL